MTVTFTPLDGRPFTLAPEARVVVAGYTGRDADQVRRHIDELARIGVAPPPRVPMPYLMPAALLSTARDITVAGARTSGEVEPVYIRHDNAWHLGVGSDHTDRALETVDVGDSKRACPKPVGPSVVPITDWKDFDFDACRASSAVDGSPYQQGPLSGLRRPEALLGLLTDDEPELADGDLVVFGGTLPLLGGTFRPGSTWVLRLTLPDGTELGHTYAVTTTNTES